VGEAVALGRLVAKQQNDRFVKARGVGRNVAPPAQLCLPSLIERRSSCPDGQHLVHRRRGQIPQRHGCAEKGPGEARSRRKSGPLSRLSTLPGSFSAQPRRGWIKNRRFRVGSAQNIDIFLRLASSNWRFLLPAVAMRNLSTPPSAASTVSRGSAMRSLRSH